MANILCLAHYCDIHGPTPLMVTEGLPVPCSTCIEDRQERERSKSGRRSLSSPEELAKSRRRVNRAVSSSSNREIESDLQTIHRTSFSSVIETPPQSPRLAGVPSVQNRSRHRRDSSFRKTYDENDRKRAIPCENCALTLPKKVKDENPQGVSRSPTTSARFDSGGPILRTRKPYERISTSSDEISPKSTPSDSDESDGDPSRPHRALKRTATYSSVSSYASSHSQSHAHYIDYTSTHDPLSSTSFSILRASCLRTLSCETLPPNNANTSPSAPTSPLTWNPHRAGSTASAPLTSTSGGSLFFGDPQAGYTTAYIFRIPDPYARGRRRVYAFICLSSAHERAAMRAFPFLSAAFRDLASWIQTLAEMEADRDDGVSSPVPDLYSPRSFSLTSPHLAQHPASIRPLDSRYGPSVAAAAAVTTPTTDSDPDLKGKKPTLSPQRASAFLAGRPCDPDGFQRRGAAGQIRSRGLAELVGRPDFFIELHARFVALLAQLSVLFAGCGGSLSV